MPQSTMPLFVIIGYDVANSTQQRQKIRPEHIARLDELHAQNRLIIAGPTPITHGESAISGSVIIAQFEDLAAAQCWANEEPYLLNGVYSHIEIKPFVQVY